MSTASEPTTNEAAAPRADLQTGTAAARRVRVAYLVNQYPQPSHSFIRREMRALETQGYAIERFTIRRWDGDLADADDRDECARTTAILDLGLAGLTFGAAAALARGPRRFFSTLAFAVRLGRRSDRGVLRHLMYFIEACALVRLLARRRVEHVHAHFGTNSTTVAMLCRALGGPTYSFTVHGPEEFDKPEFLHLGEKIERAEFVVAISDFGRSQLYRRCSFEHWAKIQLVRCGVDAQFHDLPPSPPPVEPRLVCVARLHEQKGLPVLVDAASRLRNEGVPFHIAVVGDGPLRAVLERRIAALGLDSSIELAGWKSNADVRAAILESRALVLPSFAEGLPVVIMEALALHRPVVSTFVAGIPELVTDGVNGRLVPAGAVEPLAAAMREMLEASGEKMAAMGREGARRVAARHQASREAERLAELFESVRRRGAGEYR